MRLNWGNSLRFFDQLFSLQYNNLISYPIIAFVLFIMLVLLGGSEEFVVCSSSKFSVFDEIKTVRKEKPKVFNFNPNLISIDSMVLLGFSYKQALAIDRYRLKSDGFKKKSDFARMFVVPDYMYHKLQDYIVLPTYKPMKKRINKKKSRQKEVKRSYLLPSKHTEQATLDINKVSFLELQRHFKMSEIEAKRFLSYKKLLSGFSDMSQLYDVYDLDSVIVANLKKECAVYNVQKKYITRELVTKKKSHPYLRGKTKKIVMEYLNIEKLDTMRVETVEGEGVLSQEVIEKLRLCFN